jgi:predicted Zn-dependent protease with MMP-like domain
MPAHLSLEEFERVVAEVFDGLPELFHKSIDNVQIVVEEEVDEPRGRAVRGGTRGGAVLLGLYEGVPLPGRGPWYGTTPVLPDRITLFKRNLETYSRTGQDLRENIRDTLIHEIGHYYGMTERQIRAAGY